MPRDTYFTSLVLSVCVLAGCRSGRRELRINGRYVLDVSFGDFPYAVRFTPQR